MTETNMNDLIKRVHQEYQRIGHNVDAAFAKYADSSCELLLGEKWEEMSSSELIAAAKEHGVSIPTNENHKKVIVKLIKKAISNARLVGRNGREGPIVKCDFTNKKETEDEQQVRVLTAMMCIVHLRTQSWSGWVWEKISMLRRLAGTKSILFVLAVIFGAAALHYGYRYENVQALSKFAIEQITGTKEGITRGILRIVSYVEAEMPNLAKQYVVSGLISFIHKNLLPTHKNLLPPPQ